MSTTTQPTQTAPRWPRHHDGRALLPREVAQHDPVLARRLCVDALQRTLARFAPDRAAVIVETPTGIGAAVVWPV